MDNLAARRETFRLAVGLPRMLGRVGLGDALDMADISAWIRH